MCFYFSHARHIPSLPLPAHPDTLVLIHAQEPRTPPDPDQMIAHGLLQPALEHSAPGLLTPFAWPERAAHPNLSPQAFLQQIRWGHVPAPSLHARLVRGFEVALVEEERLWLTWDHRAIGGRALQETKKARR